MGLLSTLQDLMNIGENSGKITSFHQQWRTTLSTNPLGRYGTPGSIKRKMAVDGRWLPGKYVWGKRAFNIQTPLCQPLAFAVAESIGARWSPILRDGAARKR